MAKLTKPARDRMSATKFAFPKQRKELLENWFGIGQKKNRERSFGGEPGYAECHCTIYFTCP